MPNFWRSKKILNFCRPYFCDLKELVNLCKVYFGKENVLLFILQNALPIRYKLSRKGLQYQDVVDFNYDFENFQEDYGSWIISVNKLREQD